MVRYHTNGAMHNRFQVVSVEWTLSNDREARELFRTRGRCLARNVQR